MARADSELWSGVFSSGEYWCLNREGLGHASNEDGQFVDPDRRFFLSADGITGGGTGRLAAKVFLGTIRDYFRDAGTANLEVSTLLRKGAEKCAFHRFGNVGVSPQGGVVYAAAEIVESGRLRVYWQGDAEVIKFLPVVALDEQGRKRLVPQGIAGLTRPDRPDPAHPAVDNAVALGDPGIFQCRDFPLGRGEYVLLFSDGVGDNLSFQRIAEYILAAHTASGRQDHRTRLMSRALLGLDQEISASMGGRIRGHRGKPDNYNLIVVRYDGFSR
jgi:serine/threonine protein phosphatase PrpC